MAAQSAQFNQILAAYRPTVAFPLQSTIKLVKLFQPTSIPACAVWFDAADPYALNNQSTIATGTVISTLKNKGTAPSLQAQAAASVSPTYSSIAGYPALAFNGFKALSTTAFTLSNTQGTTWFATYATAANLAAAATAAVFGTIGSPERAIRQSNTSQFVGHSIHTGTTRTATDAGAVNQLSFYTILDTPTTFTAFKNGSVLTSTTTNVTYMSGNAQNARIGIWDSMFTGSIAELIAYDAPLTVSQRQQVEGYLAWKWGLQAALPATHPYLSSTTLATGSFPQVPIVRTFYNTPGPILVTSISFSGTLGSVQVNWSSIATNPSYTVNLYSNPTSSTTGGTFITTTSVSALTATLTGQFSTTLYYYVTVIGSIFGGPSSAATSPAFSIPPTRAQLYPLAAYALVPIANAVSPSSATPATIWSTTLPTVSASGPAALTLFFNLYSAANFTAGQTFTYAIYLNGTALSLADSTAVTYTQTATGAYAMESAGVILGSGGISSLAPLQLFFTLPTGTNTLSLALISSSAALSTSVQTGVTATLLYYVPNTYSSLLTLSTYALTALPIAVPASSATPTTVWGTYLPLTTGTKSAVVSLFFNLYSAANFTAGQTFTYGLYLNGTALALGDSTTLRYTQTATGTYAIESGGILLGTNGISPVLPLNFLLTLPTGTNRLTLGISNSSAPMSTSVQLGVSAILLYV